MYSSVILLYLLAAFYLDDLRAGLRRPRPAAEPAVVDR
jgi:hypothetical protein